MDFSILDIYTVNIEITEFFNGFGLNNGAFSRKIFFM